MGLLPHTETITGWSTSMVVLAGSVTIPTGTTVTTTNLQILPANIGVPPAIGTSNLSAWSTVYPQTMRGAVFLNPNGSAAGAASNQALIPRAMAAGATGTLGSELLLDLTMYNADIISALATVRSNTRGTQAKNAIVSAIDNVNKLVYIQIQSQAGAAQSLAVGETVSFLVLVKDSAGI